MIKKLRGIFFAMEQFFPYTALSFWTLVAPAQNFCFPLVGSFKVRRRRFEALNLAYLLYWKLQGGEEDTGGEAS